MYIDCVEYAFQKKNIDKVDLLLWHVYYFGLIKKQNKNIHPETQQQQNPKHSKFSKALNLPPLKPCD